MNKTLIGKNNYLFLINDSCRELEVHCNNLLLVQDIKLSHLKIFDNYMIIIFPNKSLYYKKFLPDEYIITYNIQANNNVIIFICSIVVQDI